MNAITTTTAPKMTKAGITLMTIIGRGQTSFFDGGITEGEGIWHECLTGETAGTENMPKSAKGVANVIQKLAQDGYLHLTDNNQPGDTDGVWVSLTALGADTANELGAEGSTETPAAAPAAEKPAKAAAKSTTKAYQLPKGYQLKYPHGGYDLLSRTDKTASTPAWYVTCNAHGDMTTADTAKQGDALGKRDAMGSWCKGDHKPAAKATATPAKQAAPAKPAATATKKATAAKSTAKAPAKSPAKSTAKKSTTTKKATAKKA